MKSFLRGILFNAFSLFVLSLILPGVQVSGGVASYLFGGIALSLLFTLLKPILSILALPLNLLTLGAFSFLINVIIFYLMTVFVPTISITAFTFPGLTYAGFVIPSMHFNVLFAFIIVAFLQSLIVSALSWLIKR